MWNTFIASFVFNHRSVSDLLRKLSRNSQLRQKCGLKPHFFKQPDETYKMCIVPSEAAYSRFLHNLMQCSKEMKELFDELNAYMYANLEGYGEELAGDGKAIQTYAKKNTKKKGNRGDHEANWGVKKYTESLIYKFPPQISDKRIFRIKLEEDRRIFTPIARDSKKWVREYKKRTSVERENGNKW